MRKYMYKYRARVCEYLESFAYFGFHNNLSGLQARFDA